MVGTQMAVIASEGDQGILFGPQVSQSLGVLAYIITVMSTLTMVGRFYARAYIISLVSIDDYVMLLAWVCSIGVTTCWLLLLDTGLQEACHLDDSTYVTTMKTILSSIMLSYAGLQLMKVGWGLFLLKLLPVGSKWRLPIHILCALTMLLMVAQIAALSTHCRPFNTFWETPEKAASNCRPSIVTYSCTVAFSAADVLFNLIFATIPLPILWNVHCQKVKRLLLLSLMSIGYFTCACSVIKMALVTQRTKGVSHWSPMFFNWNLIEIHVGITAASIPTVWPIITLFYTKWLRPNYRRLRQRWSKNDTTHDNRNDSSNRNEHNTFYQQQSQGSRTAITGNQHDDEIHIKSPVSNTFSQMVAAHNPGYDSKPPASDNSTLRPWVNSAVMGHSGHASMSVLSDYSRTSSTPFWETSSSSGGRAAFVSPPASSWPSNSSANDMAIYREWEIRVESAYVKDVG